MQRHHVLPSVIVVSILLAWGTLLLRSRFPTPMPPAASAGPLNPTPDSWQDASSAQRSAAIASIQAQLNAFKKNDFKKAAEYQRGGIRRNFGTVENFRTVITGDYPQFANFKKVQFGRARSSRKGTIISVAVSITGMDGGTVRALYFMVFENRIYRVDGVSGGRQRRLFPRRTQPDLNISI